MTFAIDKMDGLGLSNIAHRAKKKKTEAMPRKLRYVCGTSYRRNTQREQQDEALQL